MRDPYPYAPDPANPANPANIRYASHWSFLFGPSITIGNVGRDL